MNIKGGVLKIDKFLNNQRKEQQDVNAREKIMEYSIIKILGQGAYATVKFAMHK